MYPFASVTWAWQEIWAAVHRGAPWTPETLTWSNDVHARWSDPACVVTQICGGPFAAVHHADMHLVGTLALDIPEADGSHYHSVLLTPHDRRLDELVGQDTHVVANGDDSLSGWVSLLAATVGVGNDWPGRVTFTGTHHASLSALARGEADLASIDSWTLALIAAEQPDLIAGLKRVGRGPWVPTPAITARRRLPLEQVDQLRSALREALADPATEPARTVLRVTGFADAELDDYLAILTLGPSA
jgi:ABC-type phosphate/phosphonate transport system substrate-binding protein